jgi:DNA-binding response OmpR family regulator
MGERILVVDDNRSSSDILCKFLENFGYEAVVCQNGEDCLLELSGGNATIIFIEIHMKGTSGLDLLSAVRQQYDPVELPIIMLSNTLEDKTITKAFGLGANDFLQKPINCKTTIARICCQMLNSELHKESLEKKRNETIKTMVATYNHHIINTLSVACAELHLAQRNNDPKKLKRVSTALRDISTVVKKIKDFNLDEFEETGYLMGEKMLDLKKAAKI